MVTGYHREYDELILVSQRAEALSRIYSALEGITPECDKIPKRWMEPIPEGPLKGIKAFLDVDDMRDAIREFYKMRG